MEEKKNWADRQGNVKPEVLFGIFAARRQSHSEQRRNWTNSVVRCEVNLESIKTITHEITNLNVPPHANSTLPTFFLTIICPF